MASCSIINKAEPESNSEKYIVNIRHKFGKEDEFIKTLKYICLRIMFIFEFNILPNDVQ